MNPKYIDILERAGWTGAQGALGVLIASSSDISAWWAVPVALALSAAKTWVVNQSKAAPTEGGTL